MSSERAKKSAMSCMISIAGLALLRLCMMMTGTRRSATNPGHAGIALKSPDVVGDASPLIERPGDDRRFHAVDRDGNAQRHDLR